MMKRMVHLLVVLTLITALIAIPGSLAQAQRARKRIVWSNALPTVCLDPAFGGRLPDWNTRMNIFNQLVTHKPGTLTEVAPDLAERWTVSPDGTVYTFFLRSGVKWHEGYGDLTAQDVKYSWDRLLDPATRAADNTDLKPVKSIEVVDARTVRVTLDAPTPGWLVSIANSAWTYVVNRRAVEERGNQHCLRPIGTGPYRVVRAEARGGAVLIANDDYWGGRPKIDDVEMRIIPEEAVAVLGLRSGDLDYMIVREFANIALLRRVQDTVVNVDDHFSASPYLLTMNNSRKPFNDVRVRRAMIHAIDRKTLVVKVTEALATRVAHSIVPPALFGFTEDLTKYEFDRAKAKRLLTEAGYPNGLKTSIIVLNSAYHPAVALILQAMWKQVGIDVQIDLIDVVARAARHRTGDYDMTLANRTSAEVTQALLEFDSRNIPGQNLSQYRGQGIDRLVDAQFHENDPQKRAAMIKRIQQQIAADVPAIPLWYVAEGTAARNTVKGMIPNLSWWQTRFYLFDNER
jgi:peptide/nickel transport system substrate-binding protein